MTMTTPPILTCLLLAALQDPAAMRLVRTPQLADSLEQKLIGFERRQKDPRAKSESVQVTEGELNSYLNSTKLRLPDGLSDVEFLLERDDIDAKAQLDLDLVRGKAKVGSGPFDPLSLLSGRIPVELRGRLKSEADGFGAFEIHEVRLGPLPLPVASLAGIVTAATRSAQYPQGFDIRAPFRLPYALKRVRVQPGRALLDF
jgi:hypothetical protein